MDTRLPPDEYYGIEVPGIVKNDEKIIQMLGGPDEILYAFECDKRRIKLSFRPHMLYAKPACGDATPATGLLMRIRRYRNRISGETKLVPTVVGRVTRMYKFETMVDFQFGPFERVSSKLPSATSVYPTTNDDYRVFYEDLIIREPTTVLDPFLSRDTPLYLPPLLFSRQVLPLSYNFASRYRTSEYIELEEQSQQLAVARKARPSYGSIVGYEDPTPPAPHPQAVKRMVALSPLGGKVFAKFEELFNSRPVWVRNALVYHLGTESRQAIFKCGILAFAYYFVRGPWGRTWVRYGYDPRTDPEARYFQVIDFRIKSHVLIRKILERNFSRKSVSIMTETKRNYGLRQRRSDGNLMWLGVESEEGLSRSRSSTSLKLETDPSEATFEDINQLGDGEEDALDSSTQQGDFRFSPSHLPRTQQTTYCLADIEIPEVQHIVGERPIRTTCDPVDGWLNPGQPARIRELMTRYLQRWLLESDLTNQPDS